MKRSIILSLCLCLLLASCAAPQSTVKEPLPTEPEGNKAVLLSSYALAEALKPDLPEEPTHAEVEAFYDANDPSVLGEEVYDAAQQAFWEEFDERSRAYYDALKAFKGDGVDISATAGFLDYTKATSERIFAAHPGENTVYSPANLYLALSMLGAVTDGESRAQVVELLGQADMDAVRSAANALWRTLYEDTASGKTTLANSVWLSDRQEYNEETVTQVAKDFYASLYSVPMGEKETDEAIAAWLNENTGGLLTDAAKEVTTEPETVLALLSTLYFYDQWTEEFAEHLTAADSFTAANGKEQSVDFMHKTQTAGGYFRSEEEGYTVAQLAFRNGAKMRFLLPDEGVALEDLPVAGALQIYDMGVAIMAGKIEWSVPKFDVSANLDLIEALSELGVTDVFDENKADFSPLADFDEAVRVTKVQHAARVKVDEIGCEAAAFTAIIAEATAAAPEELPVIEMNLNRPFAFMITGVTGMPLMLGTVNSVV
ncbi:MAG: hypothetical protein IKL99_00900 [Oscillospiraceae bacterium]|nr:hypothetical protein [Oscillospiraceae bacterium]